MATDSIYAERALAFISDYLLGKNFYKGSQASSIIIHDILMEYSREYRKEYRIINRLARIRKESHYGINNDTKPIIPEGIESQACFEILTGYLLGKNYYIVDSVGVEQGNAVMMHDILYKYSSLYRRECNLENRLKKIQDESDFGIRKEKRE